MKTSTGVEISRQQRWASVILLCMPGVRREQSVRVYWKKEKIEANLWREAEKPGGKIEVVPKDNLVSVFHSSVFLSNYSTYLPRATMDQLVERERDNK